MEKDSRTRLKEWLASGQARLQPLTFPQRELWETSPVAPEDPANNICSFFEVKGPVIFELCEDAIRRIVERQEVMRTSFLPAKDQAVQVIRSAGEPALGYRELSQAETRPEALEEVMVESFRKPFDFLRGPLYRMEILKRGPDDHVLAFTIHHAVADGWTLGAFVEDLCTAYIMAIREAGKGGDMAGIRGMRESLAPLPMTYSDWGAAERARWQPALLESHADFWRQRLAGSRCVLESSTSPDRGKPEMLTKWVTEIPGDLAEAIRSLARKTGATLFSTLLAAFQCALSRWSGVDDIVVGSPVANRTKVSVHQTMGYFSGVVPLRGYVDRTRPFADRLRTVHEETMDAFAHAMPFAELAQAVGAPSAAGRHVVYDTRFALQNHPVPDVVLPGVTTKLRTWSTGTARFDIGCELTEDGAGFEVVWLHRPSVVPAAEVRDLDGLFREVLKTVCREPDIHPDAMRV